MSSELWYTTREETLEGASVRTSADAFNLGRVWWCEPLTIFPSKCEREILTGSTKLFCHISNRDADVMMAYLDMMAIIKFLEDSSSTCRVDWNVRFNEAPLGEVKAGAATRELKSRIDDFINTYPGDLDAVESLPREQILAQYPDR